MVRISWSSPLESKTHPSHGGKDGGSGRGNGPLPEQNNLYRFMDQAPRTSPEMIRQQTMNQMRKLSQPSTIPAVAIPSPEWVGGKARVSLRAMLPVTMAATPPTTGRNRIPTIPEIRLTSASVLVGRVGGVLSGTFG